MEKLYFPSQGRFLRKLGRRCREHSIVLLTCHRIIEIDDDKSTRRDIAWHGFDKKALIGEYRALRIGNPQSILGRIDRSVRIIIELDIPRRLVIVRPVLEKLDTVG